MTVSPASGETATVSSGTTEYGLPELAGQLNLAGQVNATDTVTKPTNLSAGATTTAVSTRDRFGWLIPSGETRSVPSGQQTFGLPLLDGQLEVSGQLNVTEVGTDTASVAGASMITASGTKAVSAGPANLSAGATVASVGSRTASATGLFAAGALGTFRRTRLYGKVSLSSGATTTATGNATRFSASSLASGANITASGAKFLGTATALLSSGSEITADDTAFRTTATKTLSGGATVTGSETRRRVAIAALEAGADIEIVGTLVEPLIRGNSYDVDWHEDDDIDLGADSDGTQ